MSELRLAHTADLDADARRAARALLDAAFEGDMSDDDWEHALGGMHALVWEDGELVGHASVVQRRILHGGRALRAGYVEAVGFRAPDPDDGGLLALPGHLVSRPCRCGWMPARSSICACVRADCVPTSACGCGAPRAGRCRSSSPTTGPSSPTAPGSRATPRR